MWFASGSNFLQMWTAVHLITFGIGFSLSFGISAVQAKHIPEVIYRSCQLGSKAVILIPISTGFRAISDVLLPSGYLSIGGRQFDYPEVFAFATSSAIVFFLLFTLFSWLAERSIDVGQGR